MSDRSKEVPAFDLLSEELQQLKFHGDPGLVVDLTAPWGLSFDAMQGTAPFYAVAEGSCFLEIPGTDTPSWTADLHVGDLVVLPRGTAHQIRSDLGIRTLSFSKLASRTSTSRRTALSWGGGGAHTRLIGGFFRFDSIFAVPFLRSLGQVLLVRALDPDRPKGIRSVLELFCQEGSLQEPGAGAAMSALLKLLFIQLVRSAMAEHRKSGQECEKNPIALMFDPSLQSVGEALHLKPEHPWTVADLAGLAGFSRTSFAVRFQNLTGTSPLAYLTRIRMMRAVAKLEQTKETLETIAAEVGYGSEAAFSIAFKREMGLSPGTYRKKQFAQAVASSGRE